MDNQISKPEIILDTKNDYYNLPLASFTFGRDGDKKLFQVSSKQDKEEPKIKKEEKENGKETEILYSIPMNIENRKNLSKPKVIYSTFINKIGSHNSFLSVILHSIYHMKKLRNYIINELSEIKEKDQKSKLLYYIRTILLKYPDNKKIDLTSLRNCLAELFQNRRKFLLDHPDDPCDCYFAIINSLHSFFMQFNSNEITDESCREKCFAHRFLWLDLLRVDECECKGTTKRLFSNFNYVFDIPMEQIFDLMKTTVIMQSEPSNVIKTKERHISQIPYAMNEFQGKLFSYYKVLFNQARINCPVNGTRCNINYTHKKLVLNNTPIYLVFSLQQQSRANGLFAYSVMDILRSFVLIPHRFDISQLFEVSQTNNKNGYSNPNIFDFYGCVMMRNSRVYTCVFKKHSTWLYFEDENIVYLSSWFDVIAYCLKVGDIPIMLYYQIENENNQIIELSQDDILLLERYGINADNISKSLQNKIRINEEVIPIQEKGKIRPVPINENNAKMNSIPIPIHNNANVIVNGNEYNGEYMCHNCYYKNKMDNKICLKCGANNSDIINDIFNNIRQSDIRTYQLPIGVTTPSSKISLGNSNSNNGNNKSNSKSSSYNNGSANKNQLMNPFKVEKKKIPMASLNEDDEQHARKYFDMPRQVIPKKKAPVIIRSPAASSPQNQNSIITNQNQNKQIASLVKNDNKVISTDNRPRTSKKPTTHLNHSNMNISPDTWICSNCNTTNKDYDMRCKSKNIQLILYRLYA